MTRLIDADNLHTLLVKEHAFGELTAKKAIRAIEQAPTVAAKPVRHGKWIVAPFTFLFKDVYSDTQIVCNCCKCVFDTLDNDTDRFKYCPNCGARMDEE